MPRPPCPCPCCVSCCCAQAPRSTAAGRRPCRATAAAGARAPLVQPGTRQQATAPHLLCRCCRAKQKQTQRKDRRQQQQQVLCCQQPRQLLGLVLQGRSQQAGGAQRPQCLSGGLPQPTREQQQPRRVSPRAAAAAGRITWRAACGWASTRCRRSPWQLPGGWQRGMMGRRVMWMETTLCQSLAAAITPAASWGAPAWGAAWTAVWEGVCRARSGAVQALVAVEVEHWQRTQTLVGVAVG